MNKKKSKNYIFCNGKKSKLIFVFVEPFQVSKEKQNCGEKNKTRRKEDKETNKKEHSKTAKSVSKKNNNLLRVKK